MVIIAYKIISSLYMHALIEDKPFHSNIKKTMLVQCLYSNDIAIHM